VFLGGGIVGFVFEAGGADPFEHVLVVEHLHLIVHAKENTYFGMLSVSAESEAWLHLRHPGLDVIVALDCFAADAGADSSSDARTKPELSKAVFIICVLRVKVDISPPIPVIDHDVFQPLRITFLHSSFQVPSRCLIDHVQSRISSKSFLSIDVLRLKQPTRIQFCDSVIGRPYHKDLAVHGCAKPFVHSVFALVAAIVALAFFEAVLLESVHRNSDFLC